MRGVERALSSVEPRHPSAIYWNCKNLEKIRAILPRTNLHSSALSSPFLTISSHFWGTRRQEYFRAVAERLQRRDNFIERIDSSRVSGNVTRKRGQYVITRNHVTLIEVGTMLRLNRSRRRTFTCSPIVDSTAIAISACANPSYSGWFARMVWLLCQSTTRRHVHYSTVRRA